MNNLAIMKDLFIVSGVIFFVVLRRIACQPSYDVIDGSTSMRYSSRSLNAPEFLRNSMAEIFRADGGLSAAPVDIDHYNMMVDADKECRANKIGRHVSAAYVVYMHKGFHTDAMLQASCPVMEKWRQVSNRLQDAARSIVKAFGMHGHRDIDVSYILLPYPGNAFNDSDAMSIGMEVDYLKNAGKYYDPIKLGVSSGQFQYIQPSPVMQRQWLTRELTPVCLHKIYGGWYQFGAVLFVTVPNEPNYRLYVYNELTATFVSEKEGRYHLLARALDNGVNDAWRDYPEWSSSGIRYDIRTYTWEKTGLYCRLDDSPFVNGTIIAEAFNNLVNPGLDRFHFLRKRNIRGAVVPVAPVYSDTLDSRGRGHQLNEPFSVTIPSNGSSIPSPMPLYQNIMEGAHQAEDLSTASHSTESYNEVDERPSTEARNFDEEMQRHLANFSDTDPTTKRSSN